MRQSDLTPVLIVTGEVIQSDWFDCESWGKSVKQNWYISFEFVTGEIIQWELEIVSVRHGCSA